MASTVWKGHLTFGLISIPIRLFVAARTERVSFHQLHKVCQTRVRQPLFCPTCKRMVDRSEIVKGYEYEKDQYVLFSDEELERVEPESANTIAILQFVETGEVDPLYFDSSYYVTPEEAGEKAYQLLLKTMEESGHAAIAKLAMHQREYVVVIRPRGHGLTLHTMFYPEEIREVAGYVQSDHTELKEQEKKLALQLIDNLSAPFDPEKYHDEYQHALRDMIAAKLKGQEVTEAPHPKRAPVIDLMEALKKSLAEKQTGGMKPPKRAVPASMQGRKKAGKKSAG